MKSMTFKKTVAAAVLAGVSSSFAANNGVGGYWVDNIIPNSWAVQNTLMQSVTGYNYSCGPTALLFASNHYTRKSTGKNSQNMSTVVASKNTIAGIYTFINVSLNSSLGTSIDQMKLVARNKFGWTNAVRMDGTGATSVAQNMDNLINDLNQDIPAMGVLKSTYVNNPVGKFDHIILLTAYNRRTDENGRAPFNTANTRNLDTIDWYDPYHGKQGSVLRKDWSSAFGMSYFSFVRLGR